MITYVTGDATDPQVPGNKVIAHVCNDVGGWGRGFVLSLSRKWPQPEQSYRRWYQEQDNAEEWPPMKLGETVFVPVQPDIYVANMIGQHGIMPKDDGTPPIRYGALEECLRDVERFARDWDHASIHMPRIGCGLAGGEWSEVEKILDRVFAHSEVYVYDFNTGDARTIPWKK